MLHRDPDSIPIGKSESTSEARARLAAFRDKVSNGRLVDYWDNATGLSGLVALSMVNATKTFPGIGWIRANRVTSDELLEKLHSLTEERDSLKRELEATLSTPEIVDLAPLEAIFVISGTARKVRRWMPSGKKTLDERADWTAETTWKEIFLLISPYMADFGSEYEIKKSLESSLEKGLYQFISIDKQKFKTVRIQLQAHKLIEVQHNRNGVELWRLTRKGYELMMQDRTVKADS